MTGALVVMAPHPDDEILGAGGIMARARSAGQRVGVIVLTDGAQSHPDQCAQTLRARRAAECHSGLAAMLGEEPPLLMLGYPDGQFDARKPDISAGSTIGAFLQAVEPATLLVTDPADGHPDHKAAFGLGTRIVAQGLAQQLAVMPVSQRIDGPFEALGFACLPVAEFTAAKRRAIACHTSQTLAPDGFTLSQAVCETFVQDEFIRPVYDSTAETARAQSVGPEYFDALFADSPDPWDYQSSAYEAERFERTIAALGGRRFNTALELGCANGVLTRKLALHCDEIIALDASATALDIAREHLIDSGNVTLCHGSQPDDLPIGQFDLIVLSDFLYYLGFAGCVALAHDIKSRAASGGLILMANYLGETECALTGEMAAEIMIAHLPGWTVTHRDRCDRLRIDVLELG